MRCERSEPLEDAQLNKESFTWPQLLARWLLDAPPARGMTTKRLRLWLILAPMGSSPGVTKVDILFIWFAGEHPADAGAHRFALGLAHARAQRRLIGDACRPLEH